MNTGQAITAAAAVATFVGVHEPTHSGRLFRPFSLELSSTTTNLPPPLSGLWPLMFLQFNCNNSNSSNLVADLHLGNKTPDLVVRKYCHCLRYKWGLKMNGTFISFYYQWASSKEHFLFPHPQKEQPALQNGQKLEKEKEFIGA